ncbi:hypothetical protein JZ751_025857, partial [Albula glossodonta]
DSFQDGIKAETNTVHAVEGNSVRLSCNYTASEIRSSSLHWYRQYPRSAPQFIILIHGSKDKEEKDGFTVKHDNQNKSKMQCEDAVHQNHTIFAIEKERALLYCQYETTAAGFTLFWYIQQDDKSPELIYNEYSQDNKKGFKARNKKSAKTFNLEIAAAGLSDSATYYCALRPTLCESV